MTTLASPIQKSDYKTDRGKPMPDFNHGTIQANLSFLLKLDYRQQYRIVSELHLETKPRPKVPDLAIFPFRKFDPDKNEIRTKEAPLCAIEILSEEQAMTELLSKRFVYFDFGVKTYWLVLPASQTIYVYSSPLEFEVFSKKEILKDPVLGIRLKLASIFE